MTFRNTRGVLFDYHSIPVDPLYDRVGSCSEKGRGLNGLRFMVQGSRLVSYNKEVVPIV